MMKIIAAVIAGILLPFAFAPYGFYPLAVISPLLLLYLLEKTPARKAALLGFFYGIGCFGKGVYWIYISIHEFGNSPIWLAGLITVLFIVILSLFPAINTYFLNRFFKTSNYSRYCLAFPAAWALVEWIRSWSFTGFPWLLLGQSQTNSPLHGYAPVVGVYGVSFLVVLSAGLLFTKKIKSFFLVLIIWLGGWGLTYIPWTKPLAQSLHVTLVQGNIPQSIKWSPEQALNSFALYGRLTLSHWPSSPGLVVWPETAVTLLLQDASPLLEDLSNIAKQKHIAILTGIPVNKNHQYYNSAIVIGDGEGQYDKRHLVPFGEYTPLKSLLGKLLDILQLPMSDFIEGTPKQPLMKVQNDYIGTYICYEIAYSYLLRKDLPQANVLAVISNDTWFGQSSALGQQRQISQFAAQSAGRYMLIATNSGDTVIVDPHGQILSALPINKTAVLEGEVKPMTGSTPWVKIGNLPFIILFIIMLFIARKREE